MECSRIKLILDEYIAGRLDPDLNREVSSHVKGCRKCMEELAALREINDMLQVEHEVYPSSDFTALVMNGIEKERKDRKWFLAGKLPVINLGASLVLAGLLVMFVNTPVVNEVINKSVSDIANGAAAINTNINITTGQLGGYFKSIIYTGGRLK